MSARDIESYDLATQQRIRDAAGKLKAARAGFRHADLESTWPNAQLISQTDLKEMAGLQNLFFNHHFTSHRRWLGPAIVLVKNIAVKIMNQLLKITMVRQVELNQHLWNLALTVQHLERRVQVLEQELREANREGRA